MKKSILLLAVLGIFIIGCSSTPKEPKPDTPAPAAIQKNLDINVSLRPGGSLQLEGDAQKVFSNSLVGVRGELIFPTDVVIDFKNALIQGDTKAGTEVNWITNLPAGLKARVRDAKPGTNRIVLLVEGTPTVVLNDAMSFRIPSSVIGSGDDYTSTQVKFEIRQGNLDLTAYSGPQTPAVNIIYLNGTIGTEMSTDVRVTLLAAALKNAVDKEINVDTWVRNLPKGLSASLRPAAAGATTLFITFRGKPTEAKNEPVNVTLPANIIGDVKEFRVPNETLHWRISGGTVNSVLIGGNVDSNIISRDVTVNLLGDEFSSDLAIGTVVNWITNMPTGLTARVKRVRSTEKTAVITVTGTPTVASADTLAITIPAAIVKARNNVSIQNNVDARFGINANTRLISFADNKFGGTNSNWANNQKSPGPLNIPQLPAIKDFQGVGIVTVRATETERLGPDNEYHWTGSRVNYGQLMEAAARLNAHAIINVIIDYTDTVETRETVRELPVGYVFSADEREKQAKGILRTMTRDNINYVVEINKVTTRNYIGTALAIRYVDGLNYLEAEQSRARAPAR